MYTPKKWSVIDGHYPVLKEVAGPSFNLSVVMLATDLTEDDYEKRTADLHLIAAAPDLLAALLAITKEAGDQFGHEEGPGTINRMAFHARQAIAKATGGLP